MIRERGCRLLAIGVRHEIAVRVVAVGHRVAGRVGDAGDAPLGVAREDHALARGMRHAVRSDRQRVAVAVPDAAQSPGLVNQEDVAFGRRVLIQIGVVQVERGVVVEIHRARPAADDPDVAAVHRHELAHGSGHRPQAHLRELQRVECLTARRQHHLERLHAAIRQREGDEVRPVRFYAPGRDECPRLCPRPAQARDTVFADPNRREIQPPAHTEVASPLVAAVVGARDANRQTRDRQLEIKERHGEVADLLKAIDDGAEGGRRDASGEVRRHQPNFIEAVEQERRIERREHPCAHRRGRSGEARPGRIAREPVFEPPARQRSTLGGPDDVHRTGDD